MSGDRARSLAVLVDGSPMPEAEARAFWTRFSDWMEAHPGDLGGFAAAEGFASVHPGVDGGRPVLRVSRTQAQRPYGPVGGGPGGATGESGTGGSPSHSSHPGPALATGRASRRARRNHAGKGRT